MGTLIASDLENTLIATTDEIKPIQKKDGFFVLSEVNMFAPLEIMCGG